MVWAVWGYRKSGNSVEIEWFGLFCVIKSQENQGDIICLGCFGLSKVRKLKEINIFGCFGGIKSQEDSERYNGLGCFFLYQKSGNSRSRIVWVVSLLSKVRKTQGDTMVLVWIFVIKSQETHEKSNGLGCFALSKVRKLKET